MAYLQESTAVMDWKDCSLVEVVPGKVSGVPLLKGTRLPADTVLENFDGGSPVAEIADNFDISEPTIRGILAYAAEEAKAIATVNVLFDHNVPKKLRQFLPGHFVKTSRELGWDMLKNGDLLNAGETNGYDVMVTGDKKSVLSAESSRPQTRADRAGDARLEYPQAQFRAGRHCGR